jgi:hypothetical protein
MSSPAFGHWLTPLLVVLLATTAAVGCDTSPRPRSSSKPTRETKVDPNDAVSPDEANAADENDPTKAAPAPASETTEAQTTGPAPPAGPLPPLTRRCATRLSIAIAGKSPSSALLANTDLAAAVDTLVGSADFAERYARFINAELNDAPAMTATEDPIYHVAKHVITNDKPWSDLFVGPYQLKANGDSMSVTNDANGLGYFRTDAWRKRYAGNEPDGLMLVGAFRLLANTTGLELTASVGNPDDDRSENGRKAAACKGCHFDAWFALDKVANLLPKKTGQDDAVTFTPSTAGAQQLFGKSVADDKALLTALVGGGGWRFQQCRSVFKFLYGRPENKCEAQTFDRCVDALAEKKTIRAAVAAAAKDPAVCR